MQTQIGAASSRFHGVSVAVNGSTTLASVVYYFSGTGNGLVVARAISARMGGALVSIPEVIDGSGIATQADTIGIVFPTHLAPLYGVPLVVEAFVRRLENLRKKYLFAVCSCGGYEIVNAVPALENLRKLIKSLGGKLSAEYSVRLPMNNLSYDHIPVPIEKNSELIIRNSKATIGDILNRVSSKRRGRHQFLRSLFNLVMTPMYAALKKACLASLRESAKEPADCDLGFRELMPLTDRSIRVDNQCNGCAICARVCPVHNIQMVDKRPIWQHQCQICFACDEWCPRNAIHHWSRADGVKYHHPDVKIEDMLTIAHR
jgi:formate hydrogenlyase subunit 6/NADH:ubiquinone oxidoreductase subunit I/flavodoxin